MRSSRLLSIGLIFLITVSGVLSVPIVGLPAPASAASPHRLGFWLQEADILTCTYNGGYDQCGGTHPAQLFFNSMFLTSPYPSSLEVMIFAVIQDETNGYGCPAGGAPGSYIKWSETFWGDLASLANAYPGIQLIYEIAFDPASTTYGVSCFQTVAQYFTQFSSVYGIGVEGEYSSGVSAAQMQQAMSTVTAAGKQFISYYVGTDVVPSGGYIIGHTNFPGGDGGGYDQVGSLSYYASAPYIGIDSGYYYAYPFPGSATCPIGSTSMNSQTAGWNQCVEQTELATAVQQPAGTRQFLELDPAFSTSSFTGASGQTTTQMWDSPVLRNWIWTDPNYASNFILSTSVPPPSTTSTLSTSSSTQTSSTSTGSTSSSSSTTTSSSATSATSSASTSTASSTTSSTTSSSSTSTQSTSTLTVTSTFYTTQTVSQPPAQTYALSVVAPCPATGAGTYAAGTAATISYAGTCSRSGGSGIRVTAWSLDGGPRTIVAVNGTSSIQVAMDGPHTVTFYSSPQYQLQLDYAAQAALVSITPPSIPGDNYWYDAGTTVNYYGKVNVNGLNASGWELDGSAPVLLSAQSHFLASFSVSSPHTLSVLLSPSCPPSGCSTSKTFYLTVQSNGLKPGGVWVDGGYYPKSVTFAWQGGTVHNITAVEGLRGSTTRYQFTHWSGSANSASPTIMLTVNETGKITAEYVVEELVYLSFTDARGNPITPEAVTLTGPAGPWTLGSNLSAWVQPSVGYRVTSATWMKWNSVMSNASSFSVSSPGILTFPLAVYPETIRATDAYGLPLQGATVNVSALDGETQSLITGSNGTAEFRVPVGLFSAIVSYLGATNQVVSGSEGSHNYAVSFLLSYPLIATLGSVAGALCIFAVLLHLRRKPGGDIQYFADPQ